MNSRDFDIINHYFITSKDADILILLQKVQINYSYVLYYNIHPVYFI